MDYSMQQATMMQHPGGWTRRRSQVLQRLQDAWLCLTGRHSLHRAWQTGYDQHAMDDSARRARGGN